VNKGGGKGQRKARVIIRVVIRSRAAKFVTQPKNDDKKARKKKEKRTQRNEMGEVPGGATIKFTKEKPPIDCSESAPSPYEPLWGEHLIESEGKTSA